MALSPARSTAGLRRSGGCGPSVCRGFTAGRTGRLSNCTRTVSRRCGIILSAGAGRSRVGWPGLRRQRRCRGTAAPHQADDSDRAEPQERKGQGAWLRYWFRCGEDGPSVQVAGEAVRCVAVAVEAAEGIFLIGVAGFDGTRSECVSYGRLAVLASRDARGKCILPLKAGPRGPSGCAAPVWS